MTSLPLAVRMRPRALDEVVGQDHLLGPGAPLRRLVTLDAPLSVFLYGPPGTGKTTLALLLAASSSRRFVEVSAVSGGVKDLRAAVEAARSLQAGEGVETVLFVDEVHRFSKSQQDSLLPAVENRWVSLVAATTENPSFSVIAPLLSRSLLAVLRPLDDAALRLLLTRAVLDERGLAGTVSLDDDAADALVRLSGGDARRMLTLLEAAAGAAGSDAQVSLELVERVADRAVVRYDQSGDQHYDVTSAFVKSLRGSDPDAALHYLARMLAAGEDPRYVARRLMVHASEDVGLADPTALTAAVNASAVVERVGMPECRLALAQATLHVALAPKSNAVMRALDGASADVAAGRGGPVPPHLRDAHYAGARRLGHGRGYLYPHDVEGFVASQQYLPDDLVGREYYAPPASGLERQAGERLRWLRDRLRRR